MNDTFKNRFNKAIELRHIKPIELSEATGISKARISQYMNGIYTPKSKATYILAKQLNVSETWLMGLDVPMERDEITNEKTAPSSEDDAIIQEILKIIRELPTDKKRKFLEAIKNLASL